MRRLLWLAPVLIAGCGNADVPNIVRLLPEIVVAPAEVDFGERAVPLAWDRSFFVSNAGRVPLEFEIAWDGDPGPFSVDVTTGTVDAGESLDVDVRFTPPTFLDYSATLRITSNDEDSPEVLVPVKGTGVSAPLPDIDVTPTAVDFAEVSTERTEILTIRNVGTASLEIGEVLTVGSPAFQLLTDPAFTTLAAGDDLPVVLKYAPPTTDGDSASLLVRSNDPDEPEVEVVLLGNGGADYAYPIAVIDCVDEVDPPAFVQLDAYESTDPEGHLPLTYAWSLTRVPTDVGGNPISSGYLTNDVSDTTALWADAVGSYEVQLTVENAIGVRSAPAICRVTAVPAERLLIELSWSTASADLDLHLAQDGSAIFQSPGDTNWCNRRPSWGGAGGADDPRLDLDDRAGFGPENISIDEPANGRYVIRAHYFDDGGDDVVTATVRAYVDGVLAFQDNRNLERNQVWDVARVNWPEGTVGALSAELYDAPRRTCATP